VGRVDRAAPDLKQLGYVGLGRVSDPEDAHGTRKSGGSASATIMSTASSMLIIF
jgi:hypothetical protein